MLSSVLQYCSQSARLQLRYLNKSIDAVFTVSSTASQSSSPTPKVSEPSTPVNAAPQAATASVISAASTVVASTAAVTIEPPAAHIPMEIDYASHQTAINNTESVNEYASLPPRFVPSAAAVKEQIAAVLQQNFDRVTLPAIITVTKYVINILNNPESCEKFLTVNCGNKVFLEKVAPCKGAVELLNSIGFLSPEPSVFTRGTVGQSSALVMTSPVDHSFLSGVYDALQATLTELNVEEGSRPLRADPSAVQRRVEEIKAVPFDPFKTNIVRTAQQVSQLRMAIDVCMSYDGGVCRCSLRE